MTSQCIIKGIAAVAFSMFLSALPTYATVFNSNGSAADVTAKHALASNGDTITLPAGAFTWPTSVSISKAIKLQGAGSGRVRAWSSSSVAFGTGSKTFTIQTAAGIQSGWSALTAGTTVRIWRLATNKDSAFMLGTVTSLSGSTLTVNVTSSTGSGTTTPWLIATESTTKVTHSAGGSVMLSLTENSSGNVDISGIQFTSGSGTGPITQFNYTAGGQPILLHDCWFNQSSDGSDIIRMDSTTRGVMWNLSVTWTFRALSNSQFLHSLPVSRSEVWSSPSTMGMADTTGKNNIYVEDSDVHGNSAAATDFDENTKAVWRHNINNNAMMNSHGYDTGPMGNRHWEIYDNKFLFTNCGDGDGSLTLPLNNHILLRGGTGVITDNYFENISSTAWGDKPELQFGIWALGRWTTSPGSYDSGDGCVPHYPAPRQFGFGYVTGTGRDGQGNSTSGGVYVGDSEPAYIWNNTGATPVIQITTDGDACVTNQYGHIPDNPNDYIQAGRDYKLQAKPGYTKYTYPHPLRATAAPSPTPGSPPSAPQNLHVASPTP